MTFCLEYKFSLPQRPPKEQRRLSWRDSSDNAVLPCAETVPMLLWALLASGQITMRKVDGWQTLDRPIEPMALDLAA